jgi:hypothetical protein
MKFNFAGIEFVLHERNLQSDSMPLIQIKNKVVTTKEVKIHIDNILRFIANTVEVLSISDERYKKYSIALNCLNSIRGIFNAKTPEKLTEEAAKITIDVVKEIALTVEPLDGLHKKAIESAAFFAKFAIENIGKV